MDVKRPVLIILHYYNIKHKQQFMASIVAV